MTDQAGAAAPDPFAIKALARRAQRAAAIIAGDELPSINDRLAGLPPYRNNPRADLRSIAARGLASGEHSNDVLAALNHLEANPTRWAAQAARATLLACDYEYRDAAFSIDWCAALLGDGAAMERVIATCLTRSGSSSIERAQRVIFALGVKGRHAAAGEGAEWEHDPEAWSDNFTRGTNVAAQFSKDFAAFQAAAAALEADGEAPEQSREDAALADLFRMAEEDRAEIETADGIPNFEIDTESTENDPSEIPVTAELPSTGTAWRKELYKGWAGIAGKPLPLAQRGDVPAHMLALASRWPHAAGVIETILSDLAPRESVRFRPTLLVGSPGSGKSALARAIAVQIGLSVELISLAGSSDSSMMGTSAQWSSARESLPLQLIKRERSANPLIIWDEVEKASPDRRNGSALDGLLGLLEPDQARHYRDPALEVECDLSWVSHIATANDLALVPAPLRDRMRVLTMPEPGWQHLGTLTANIIADLAKSRGLDRRWIEPLGQDEIELIKRAWPGGSIRKLTRIVTTLIEGRDKNLGRA